MNNNQFSASAEVDSLFADLHKNLETVFNKYGVTDALVNQVLVECQRLEKSVSSEQNRPPSDGLDFATPCKRQRMLPYDWRIDREFTAN